MNKNKATLYLIHGFIGFGKTTFAKKLERETSATRFTHDEIVIERYGVNPPQNKFKEYFDLVCQDIKCKTEELLKDGKDIILDFGFWTKDDRDEYQKLAKTLNAECIIYSISCDIETAKQRCLLRTSNMPEGALFIDENAFNLFLKVFEPLHEDEEAIIINN